MLKNGLSYCAMFFDFDNTITTFDVLDDIIKRFSINDRWKKLEKDWVAGRIGSKECLRGQLTGLRVTKRALSEYLSGVSIDGNFKKLLALLDENNVKPIIVSDDFSFIINSVLRDNRVKGIRVFSNSLKFSKDRLIPSFPHVNKLCASGANCKKLHLFKHGKGKKMVIYVGDGLSDICPALQADLVFAKGSLLRHLKAKKKHCVAYRGLGDVYTYLKERFYGRKA